MLIKVPPSIQVGSHTYTLWFKPELSDELLAAQVNFRTQEIGINPSRPASETAEGLTHELLHIIDRVYCGDRMGETLVTASSQGMAQVLKGLGIEFDWSLIRQKEE